MEPEKADLYQELALQEKSKSQTSHTTCTTPKYYQANTTEDSSNAQTLKILGLQEELLKCQRELSKKDACWEKERNNFLAKHEILTMEIVQYKQRLSNMAKMNSTLTEALSLGGFNPQVLRNLQIMANTILGTPFIAPTPKKLPNQKQPSPENITQTIQTINYLEQQIHELQIHLSSKQQKIAQLQEQIKSVRSQKKKQSQQIQEYEQKIDRLRQNSENQEDQILKLHKEISDLSKNYEFGVKEKRESRESNGAGRILKKKELTLQELNTDEVITNRKYSSNSSYLMLKPSSDNNTDHYDSQQESQPDQVITYQVKQPKTNFNKKISYHQNQKQKNRLSSHSSQRVKNSPMINDEEFQREYMMDDEQFFDQSSCNRDEYSSDDYYDEEDEEHLLCEVCHKVYPCSVFQEHLHKCGYRSQQEAVIRQLLRKKQAIKNKINVIDKQNQYRYRPLQPPFKSKQPQSRPSNYPKNYNNSHYSGFSIKNHL